MTQAGMVARARRLLARQGGWVEALADGYGVRPGGDRRSRVGLVLDEAGFRQLVEAPGLKRRPGGGWVARNARPERAEVPEPGRPGLIEGTRTVMEGEGRPIARRANLGQTAVAWLARRRDPDGCPLLAPAQVAAADRLTLEAEIASRGPSVTLRWDALPRAGGSAVRAEPGDPAMAAARRVEAALAACGPARPMIVAICIRASALQAAERDLGLRRREGKQLLRAGLTALATHYCIG